jgi:hypothetical protein
MLIIAEFCTRQTESRNAQPSRAILLRLHGPLRIYGIPPRPAFTTYLRFLPRSLIMRQTILARRPGRVVTGSLRADLYSSPFRDKERIYRLEENVYRDTCSMGIGTA